MGQNNAKVGPAVGNLSFEETMQLRRTFTLIPGCDTTTEKHIACSYTNFQRYCETFLDDWLAQKIADRLATKGKGGESVITLSDFQLFGSAIFNGSAEEKFEAIWSVLAEEKASADKERQFQPDEIYKYTRSIIESYVKVSQQSPQIVGWTNVLLPLSPDSVNDLALQLLQDLFHSGVNEKELISKDVQDPKTMRNSDGSTKKFSIDEVVKALSQNPLFVKIHSTVFSECFGFQKALYSSLDVLPACTANSSEKKGSSILDLPKLMFLNVQLPPESRKRWDLLFSSALHGESFAKLLGNIQNQGPTVLIIKDNAGRVFGAFAPESWTLNPKFYGDEKSFLFHLIPRFVLYSATGYNKNFQYLNTQQKTLPNGLGFGGSLEYFGLWLDSEFGKGKCSPSCTTYNCPQLSTNQEFTISHLEVWEVKEPKKFSDSEPQDEHEAYLAKRSVLDKNPESKALLEMLGRQTLSDGHREEPKN